MKNKNKKLMIGIIIIAVLAGFILTFYILKNNKVLFSPETGISVVRHISYSPDATKIVLEIDSNKKLIGIQEILPEGIVMLDYEINDEYEIFNLKYSDNAWIINDANKEINADITYYVKAYGGEELSGNFNYFDGNNYVTEEISGDSLIYSDAIEGDATRDCRVNILDLIAVRNNLNQDVSIGENWKYDVNRDGRINILDLIEVKNSLNTKCPEPLTCSDSDKQDYYAKGSITVKSGIQVNVFLEDECIDANSVKEYVCDGNEPYFIAEACENGCENGKCLKIEEPAPAEVSFPDDLIESDIDTFSYVGSYTYSEGNLNYLGADYDLAGNNYKAGAIDSTEEELGKFWISMILSDSTFVPVDAFGTRVYYSANRGVIWMFSPTRTILVETSDNKETGLVQAYLEKYPAMIIPQSLECREDATGDRRVNILDLLYVRNRLNQDASLDSIKKADVNVDGRINILDLIAVRNRLNQPCVMLSPVQKQWWKVLIALGILGLVVFLVWKNRNKRKKRR